MRVAICSGVQPFELRSRRTADRLAAACRDAGHEVEPVYLPWSGRHPVRQLAAYRWIDLASSSERMICLDLPALVVPHPMKSVWMTHPGRCVSAQIDNAVVGSAVEGAVRDVVSRIQSGALTEAIAVHVTEECAMHRAPQPVPTSLLRLPADPDDGPENAAYDGDFVCVGPFTTSSRLETVIDALAVGGSRARVGLLGGFDDPAYERTLRAHAHTKNVADLVRFEPAGREAARSLAHAAAVIQLGGCCDDLLVAAARRSKVVLTSAEALAHQLDRLATDRSHARRLGMTAAESLHSMLPTWDAVAAQLLQ